MAHYYLIAGTIDATRFATLRDCTADHIDQAEQEAIEELDHQRADGHDDAQIGVVDASTRIIEFMVNKNNVENVRGTTRIPDGTRLSYKEWLKRRPS